MVECVVCGLRLSDLNKETTLLYLITSHNWLKPIDIKFSAFFLTCIVRGVLLLVDSPVALYYKSKMATVAVLHLWLNTNYFGLDGYILTNFGGIIERIILKRPIWPDCKPEIEFKYDGRLFSETVCSNGQEVDFDLLKWVTSLRPAPGNKFVMPWPPPSKLIWRYNSTGDGPSWMKLGRPRQNHMRLTIEWSRSKPEVVIR